MCANLNHKPGSAAKRQRARMEDGCPQTYETSDATPSCQIPAAHEANKGNGWLMGTNGNEVASKGELGLKKNMCEGFRHTGK
ncbi:hypothetical protein NDU88_004300 [Pleurodeles waltl]|uniref:Uncharacterized protein n=1 Tax=Pleurodeles waltl TaxID=8319 RepID=A0AAV7W8N1_PLEWA|nr:hypothetical protein NDU88_004300 [Pleurodeles waltl]